MFLEDSKPTDTLPRHNISILQEQDFLEDNTNQELMGSETNSLDSSETVDLSDGNTSDNFLFCDLASAESVQDGVVNLSDTVSEETDEDVVDGVQLDVEVDISNILVDLATSRQDETAEIISEQSKNIQIVPVENKIYDWSPDAKKNITDLLLAYQKHLTKKYFFRSNDQITDNKKSITTALLAKLNTDTSKNFFDHVYGISTTNILNKHRDISIIQKIGQFFKHHNKTEGTLLLENIFSTLNENNTTRNTLSI